MSDGLILQCARVDRLGERHVSEKSTTAACTRCRQQVWISKPARDLAMTGAGIKPVCDVCKPAAAVTVHDIHG